jgi:DNA-binding transcriptional regulator YdaS (Cro superfamily)
MQQSKTTGVDIRCKLRNLSRMISLSDKLADAGFKLRDVAAHCGVDKSTVTRWFQSKIPAERVLEIERLTKISRHELRPDIYPEPSQQAAE